MTENIQTEEMRHGHGGRDHDNKEERRDDRRDDKEDRREDKRDDKEDRRDDRRDR